MTEKEILFYWELRAKEAKWDAVFEGVKCVFWLGILFFIGYHAHWLLPYCQVPIS